MCGRFVMFTTGEALLAQVGSLPGITEVAAPLGTPSERYNIAPTQTVALVRYDDSSSALVEPARWGLIPRWKKDLDGPPLFNARAETMRTKPSFRDAFLTQRAVLPLDGYYEWHAGSGGRKQPYYVTPPEGEMLWAAALWSHALGQLSCTMVATEAAEPMDWLHDRLPRFLLKEEISQWVSGSADDAAALLHPAPSELRSSLTWREADPAVGNVRNDYPELIDAAAGGLF